jgi:hypothetical protein
MCLGVCVDGPGDTRRRGRMGGYLAHTPTSFHGFLRWKKIKRTTVDAPPSTYGQGRTFVVGLAMTQSGRTELLAAVIVDPPEKLASMLRGVVLSS